MLLAEHLYSLVKVFRVGCFKSTLLDLKTIDFTSETKH